MKVTTDTLSRAASSVLELVVHFSPFFSFNDQRESSSLNCIRKATMFHGSAARDDDG